MLFIPMHVRRVRQTLFFQRSWVIIALLLLPKYIECFFITAPAHQHATKVAVYSALLQLPSRNDPGTMT